MVSIKPIEARSVHQIQSGQVIVDLCSVVKELVENSLDAGATSIDIRFKNNSLDAIEVQDNGAGIAADDYETLALKHYTSKLSSYDDLGSLNTFGFRGEALSSLCALSNLHVVTARDGEAPKGQRLDFETSGKLKSRSVEACLKGTTVSVEGLFHNLPVRRKELEKNIKREYGKVLGLLHAYACVSVNVRVSVSNQVAKGKKVVAFATKANRTTRENISNVFGAKTLTALVAMDLKLELQPSATPAVGDLWVGKQDWSREVKVEGHISRPVFGEGRQTPDRQMFFVNNRPCGLPQMAKAFNEVYKSYNLSQSPFVFANFLIDTHAYDVNVSPNKRTILLHDQAVLLEALKASLVDLFEDQEQTIPQSQVVLDRSTQSRLQNFTPRTSDVKTTGIASTSHDVDSSISAQTQIAAGLEDHGHARGRDGTNFADRYGQKPQINLRKLGETATNAANTAKTGLPKVNSQNNSRILVEEGQISQTSQAAVDEAQVPQAVLDFNARLAKAQSIDDLSMLQTSTNTSEAEDENIGFRPASELIHVKSMMPPPTAKSNAKSHTPIATSTGMSGPGQPRMPKQMQKRQQQSAFAGTLSAFAAPGTQTRSNDIVARDQGLTAAEAREDEEQAEEAEEDDAEKGPDQIVEIASPAQDVVSEPRRQ